VELTKIQLRWSCGPRIGILTHRVAPGVNKLKAFQAWSIFQIEVITPQLLRLIQKNQVQQFLNAEDIFALQWNLIA
jgi:hypothetical protein